MRQVKKQGKSKEEKDHFNETELILGGELSSGGLENGDNVWGYECEARVEEKIESTKKKSKHTQVRG